MRVLKIVASSARGGAEENFLALARALRARGVAVSIACDENGPMIDEYRAVCDDLLALPLGYPTHLRSISRLRTFMQRTRPQVVHTHLWNADVLGGLAALREGLPFVATVTGPYFLSLHPRAIVRWRRAAYSRGFRAIYRRAARVIACSRELADDLVQRPGLGVPRDRIEVIYNGLDLARLMTRSASDMLPPGIAPDVPARISMVANFYPIKGQDTLVAALPRLLAERPDLQVVFAGDGPDRARIEAAVRASGVAERVVFTGAIANAIPLMRHSDIVTLPSNGEGLPMVLLEAMALGRAVVASTVGGIPELIESGRNGVLVPPRDPQLLATELLSLLADSARRQRLGEAAAGMVLARWSSTMTAQQVHELYQYVLGPR